MKTDQLFYFLAAAKSQHIAKAAKQLHISPSAISHSISSLESELGLELFEKVGKNIYLTNKGKLLAERSQDILDMINKTKEDLQSDDIELTGKLRLATTHGLLHRWIVPSLSKLLNQHPKIEIECFSLRSSQVVEQVAQGSLDFGICFSPTETPMISSQVISHEQLHIAVRDRHPLLKAPEQQLAKLISSYSCAAPKAFQGIEICIDHPSLKKAAINSNPQFIYDSYDAAAVMVQQSDLWALMPDIFIKCYKLKPLHVPKFSAQTTINLITPKGRPLLKMARLFIESLGSPVLKVL